MNNKSEVAMNKTPELDANTVAYTRLKEMIGQSYPNGWFVAIADDQVVAAAVDFQELKRLLKAKGKDPRHVLVVEAGVDYPEYVTIFV